MTTSRVTRRNFIQGTAALATAASLLPTIKLDAQTATKEAWPENGTLVPDEGWRLWVDRAAEWKNDAIFLPEDVRPGGPGDLAKLPVMLPRAGGMCWRPVRGSR
jgi:beta-galactosidase